MAEIPDAIRERLLSVDGRVTRQTKIQNVWTQGASCIRGAPLIMLEQAASLSRRHPVLGTALGCGALEVAATLDDPQRVALAKLALGMGLCWWGYYIESLPFLREADAAGLPSPIGAYATWHHLVSQRRFTRTGDPFERMIAIADQLDRLGDPTGAMRCRMDGVSGKEISEKNPHLMILLKRVEAYFHQHDLGGDEGIAKTLRAYWLLRTGKLEQGLQEIEQAEDLFQRARMPAMLAWAWFEHGLYHYHKREISEAYYWIDQGIRKATALRHHYYLATMLTLKAEVQNNEGDLHESLRTLQIAKPISVELQLDGVRANNLLIAGHVQQLLGNYAVAREAYLTAREIFTRLDSSILAVLCDANLGRIAIAEGRFGDALDLLQRSIPVFKKNKEYEYYALATQFLAQAYRAFGYQDAAIQQAREGMAALRKPKAKNHSLRLAIYLASMLLAKERDKETLADAIKEADKWLAMAETLTVKHGLKRDAALAQQIRGELLLKKGDFEAASLAFQQSKIDLYRLGQTEAAHDSEIGEAESYLSGGDSQRATDVLGQMKVEMLQGGVRWRHDAASARVAISQSRPESALDAYMAAMRRMQESRWTLPHETLMEHFVGELRPVFEDAFRLAATLNRPREQLALAEMYGAQLVSVRFGQDSTDSPVGIEDRIRAEMMTQIGSGWAILRYAWQNEGLLWRFLITPDTFEAHPIPITRDLVEVFDLNTRPDTSFRKMIYGRVDDELGKRSRRILHDALIPASLREICHPDQPLIIIPSGHLYQLPFHALLDPEDQSLIQRAEVGYAPSLELLHASLTRPSIHEWNGSGSLIFAQDVFADQQFGDLQYARQEAELVQAAIRKHAEIHSGDDFQRDRLDELAENGTLRSMRRLHFITHSQYDRYSGAFMGLATRDGAIWVEDILRWKTCAELVTLSACQTGMGSAHKGDEINGMIQAFLSGGAQNVIASMWPVQDDPSGALFMEQLYQNLEEGQPPARALAQVQRQAIETNLCVFQWAPFFLTGKPTPHVKSAP